MTITCFGLVYVIWGSTYLGMKIAVTKIPPLFVGGSRFFLAGTTLMLGANGLLCMSLGRPSLPSGLAALIVATTPLWMLLLDRWQTGVGKFTPQIVVGLVVGLLGVGILMSGKLFTTSDSAPVDVVGCFMVLASCILWSVGGIVGRRVSQPPHPLASSAFQMIAGGVLLLTFSAVFEAWKPIGEIPWNNSAWIAWLYLAVFGSLIGFSAFVWLLHHVSAASVSTYAYVNPLVAIVLGWFFLDEQPGVRTAVATVFILGGVVVIQLARRHAGRASVTTVTSSDSRAE